MPLRARTKTARRPRLGAGLWWAAALCIAGPSSGCAEWGGLLGYGTDSLLHGRSLTDGAPAWFGDLHVGDARWTLGLGALTERPPFQSRGAQLNLYLDRRWRLDEDWLLRGGLVHYESPWNLWNDELRYTEVSAGLGWRGRWSLTLGHTPNLPAVDRPARYQRGRATWTETAWRQPFGGRFVLDVGLGYGDIRGIDYRRRPLEPLRDYAYASLGLGCSIGPIFLHAIASRASRPAAGYLGNPGPRARFAASAVWTF